MKNRFSIARPCCKFQSDCGCEGFPGFARQGMIVTIPPGFEGPGNCDQITGTYLIFTRGGGSVVPANCTQGQFVAGFNCDTGFPPFGTRGAELYIDVFTSLISDTEVTYTVHIQLFSITINGPPHPVNCLPAIASIGLSNNRPGATNVAQNFVYSTTYTRGKVPCDDINVDFESEAVCDFNENNFVTPGSHPDTINIEMFEA